MGIKIMLLHDIQTLQDKIVIGILKEIGEGRNNLDEEIPQTNSALQFWFRASPVHAYFPAKLTESSQKQPRRFQ